MFRNIRGFLFLIKEFYYIYFSKSNDRFNLNAELGIYTSPQKHVFDTIKKVTSNSFYIGKGKVHTFVDCKPCKKDIEISFILSKKYEWPFFEVLSLVIELKAVEKFLSFFKAKHTIYTTNFIDRFAYIYGRCSLNHKYKIIVIPHGKLMSFPLAYKYNVYKLKTTDPEDVSIFSNYAHHKEIELLSQSIYLNDLVTGGIGNIAYLSSASRSKLNYSFLINLILKSKKTILVYPHPREKKVVYLLLNLMNLIKLPAQKYHDFDIVFGRLSTLTKEIDSLNDKVVFLNYEERDLTDFPKGSNIIPVNSNLIDFKEYI